MRTVFRALGDRQRQFDWLLTDYDLNTYPPELPYTDGHRPARWFSGDQLTALVAANDIQFMWGVFSGFRPGIVVDAAEPELYPYADGNAALWSAEVTIQHPLADVEIVCWDSSCTMLLSRDDDLAYRFRAFFPEAVDLNDYNRRVAAERACLGAP